jgi:tetratricopeptide (TPR) repeat protein
LEASLEPMVQPLLALLDASAEAPQWQALDPAQRRQRTVDAVKRILLCESQLKPLLLIFEDHHWLDAGTQGILDSLVESLAGAQLLLLVSYRSEYEHHWGGKTYYTQLRVDPLPSEEAATLLQALLGANPSLELLTRPLNERTEGNPPLPLLSTLTFVRRAQGDLDGAMAAGRQALELASLLGDPPLQSEASLRLGQAYFGLGDFGRAAELVRGNVEALARGVPSLVSSWGILSRAWLAWVLGVLGEFAEGRRHGEEVLRLAMVDRRREAPVIAHGCLGLLYFEQGDWDAAVQVLDQGLALGLASGDRN